MKYENHLFTAAPDMDLVAHATKQQDAQARKLGYPSYDAMIAWQQRASEKTGGTVPKGGQPGQMATTVQGAARDATAWHPATIFQKLADAFKQVNAQ